MFKLLVVAALVVFAAAQTGPATAPAPASSSPSPAVPTPAPTGGFTPGTQTQYVLVTQYITGNNLCQVGTNYANVYSASVAFADTSNFVSFTTGVCMNSTYGSTFLGTVGYTYSGGVLTRYKWTAANCSGTPTVTVLTTNCTANNVTNGFPSSTNVVVLPYSTNLLNSLAGYVTITLNNNVPVSATFQAADVCLRIPYTVYTPYNSTLITCGSSSSAMATVATFTDNACKTPTVTPPYTPQPTPPPMTVAPTAYSVQYQCKSSAPQAPPQTAPSSPSGSGPSAGSTPGPKAPSSAAAVVLSSAAVVVAGAVLLF